VFRYGSIRETDDFGEAAYAMMIKPGERSSRQQPALPVVAVVAFEEDNRRSWGFYGSRPRSRGEAATSAAPPAASAGGREVVE
jgi:hypothetical protein